MMFRQESKPQDEDFAPVWARLEIEVSDENSEDVDADEVGDLQSGLDYSME